MTTCDHAILTLGGCCAGSTPAVAIRCDAPATFEVLLGPMPYLELAVCADHLGAVVADVTASDRYEAGRMFLVRPLDELAAVAA